MWGFGEPADGDKSCQILLGRVRTYSQGAGEVWQQAVRDNIASVCCRMCQLAVEDPSGPLSNLMTVESTHAAARERGVASFHQ
jgi:hypothetical protein